MERFSWCPIRGSRVDSVFFFKKHSLDGSSSRAIQLISVQIVLLILHAAVVFMVSIHECCEFEQRMARQTAPHAVWTDAVVVADLVGEIHEEGTENLPKKAKPHRSER